MTSKLLYVISLSILSYISNRIRTHLICPQYCVWGVCVFIFHCQTVDYQSSSLPTHTETIITNNCTHIKRIYIRGYRKHRSIQSITYMPESINYCRFGQSHADGAACLKCISNAAIAIFCSNFIYCSCFEIPVQLAFRERIFRIWVNCNCSFRITTVRTSLFLFYNQLSEIHLIRNMSRIVLCYARV